MLPKQSTLRFAALSGAILTLPALSGCLDHPLKPAELDTEQTVRDQIQLNVNKDVDILFVLDNSGSMGEEQANLAANFGAFISVLEDPAVKANYRLGVTTTDNGNPWCPGTTPEAGALVYQSCTDRLTQFTNQQGTVNVENIACTNNCSLSSADLGIGTTNGGPWLENIEGTTNLPDGVSTTQAFQCVAPQGINGCGFESQLEAMNKALIRFDTPDDEAFGFKRENALLAIVQVTDEADCSYNNAWVSIFEQSGNKAFWWDQTATFPTSAVCWNAGVACSGDPTNYDCTAQDYDVNGNPIPNGDPGAADNAVLHPLSRYISRVQGIENQKKEINPGQEVIVALIGGVGDNGQPSYADSADQTFMSDFGIGPGCQAPIETATPCTTATQATDCAGIGNAQCSPNGQCLEAQTAVPPVRLAEFTENFTTDNMFTVCSNDYAPALEAIASAIEDQLRPACYTECVQDQDLTTPGVLDPECNVFERVGQTETAVQECQRDASGAYVIDPATNDFAMPADGVNVCYAFITDATGNQTPDPNDNMSMECVDDGYNLEFKLARRPGFPAQGGSTASATCILSELPQVDCPNLN